MESPAVAYNLVLMLDISGSMRVNDGGGEVRQVDADGNATITTRLALAKAGLTIDQIDLFEVNEAFAAVVMRFMKG